MRIESINPTSTDIPAIRRPNIICRIFRLITKPFILMANLIYRIFRAIIKPIILILMENHWLLKPWIEGFKYERIVANLLKGLGAVIVIVLGLIIFYYILSATSMANW